jgi:hypothetical protein
MPDRRVDNRQSPCETPFSPTLRWLAGLLPAGRLVVTAAGAHTLIGQLVETALPFLRRHLPPATAGG